MHFWRSPCLAFSEVEDCSCGTSEQAAVRRFMMKIVPLQTPERVLPIMFNHFKNVCKARYSNRTVTFKKDKEVKNIYNSIQYTEFT